MSQNSYFHEFCALISQIVFLTDSTALMLMSCIIYCMSIIMLIIYCMSKNFKKLVFLQVLSTSIKKRVLSLFERLTVYYNCMSKNVTKLISPRVLSQVSQVVFFADLTVLRLITTI